MSASLFWKPVVNDNRYFDAGSSKAHILEKAFQGLPAKLTSEDIPKIEGMIACGYHDFQDLITAINDHDEIIVDAEY